MEFSSVPFLSALAAIIVIDLALAGDNAIVIALAARRLPAHLQKKAIVWGTVGAIAVRTVMTFAVVWLLGIPGLMAAGGAVLVWIASNLLASSKDQGHDIKAAATFGGAMQTIVVADAAMGLDNVLAVAGAAHGSFILVAMGLLISVPIVVWGSTLILKCVERNPWIVHVGVAVLAWTAASMIAAEPYFRPFYEANPWAAHALYPIVIGGVFLASMLHARRGAPPVAGDAGSSQQTLFVATKEEHMKRILIPVDGSPESLEAVRAAVSHGAAAVSCIELLNVQPLLHRHISQFVAKGDRDAWRTERAEAALAPARRIVEEAGIACRTHVRVGSYPQAVKETARALGVRDIEGVAREPLHKRFAFPAGIGVGIAIMVLADE